MSDIREELVCIDESVMHKSTSNTVEIRVTRRNEESSTPPFPTPYLRLNKIVSFDEDDMYHLLYPTLPDPNLCSILSFKIAYGAKLVPGPLYFSFHVTLTTQITEEPKMETCAICLEEEDDLMEMPNCSHVFHEYCILEWLTRSNSCPLCREVVMEEDE